MLVGTENWIELADGTAYGYGGDVVPSMEVIAKSLSRIPRFGGHSKRFYSVGEHSVNVAVWCERITTDPRVRLWALLHDAHESVLGDVMRPLKQELKASQLRPLAAGFDLGLISRELGEFGLAEYNELKRQVRVIDDQMLEAEARHLMPSGGNGWTFGAVGKYVRNDAMIEWLPRQMPLSMEEAELAFLNTYKALRLAPVQPSTP